MATCFLGNGKALVLRVLRYYCFKLQSNFRYNYPHQSKALIATDAVSVSAQSRKTLHPLFFSLSLSLSLSLCDVRQSNRIIDLASCNRKSLTKEKTSKQKNKNSQFQLDQIINKSCHFYLYNCKFYKHMLTPEASAYWQWLLWFFSEELRSYY